MIYTKKGDSKILYINKCKRCGRELLFTKSSVEIFGIRDPIRSIRCPKCKNNVKIKENDDGTFVKAEKIPFILKLRGYK